jgi:hypothetical protein
MWTLRNLTYPEFPIRFQRNIQKPAVFHRSVIPDFQCALAPENMLLISSRGQPIRGCPPTWELNADLTTSHRNQLGYYEILHRTFDMRGGGGVVTTAMKLHVQ